MIRADGPWFKDEQGRTLILHGVNLGGSSKVPYAPNGATHIREGFFDHRHVSFVGRPFPLAEADEHFGRLRAWGLTFVRLLVTWEAIEHAGPGLYDQDYLDYVAAVAERAAAHGIDLLIDPHQDVWSRFSGGDGAPGWTFEAMGMDVTGFAATEAALVHATYGDPLPTMVWPTNGARLAAATMFTLFFGGDDFAPAARIEGEPAQAYLQRRYIEAIKQLARRLRHLPNVVGYDTMNEPLSGFIGWRDLHRPGLMMQPGPMPSPFQGMALGGGYKQQVGVRRWLGRRVRRRRLIDPQGRRAWLPGRECVWRQHGVWDVDGAGRPQLLRPDHFSAVAGRPVDFGQDYYRPFANRFAREMRSVHPGVLVFVETEFARPPPRWSAQDASNIVYAPHWYDGVTLFTKRYRPWIGLDVAGRKLALGRSRVQRSFVEQLARLKAEAAGRLGGVPTLIGECGVPFDLDGGRAYRSGDFSAPTAALERTLAALDENLLSYTLWNYTADNSNRRGDQWNGEDLSLFSRDQQTDPADVHSGGRGLEAALRPYARCTAGEPLRMVFDRNRRTFLFEFRHDPAVAAPSELFVPNYQYPNGYVVDASDGVYEIDRPGQRLVYRHGQQQALHRIRISPR